MNPPANSTELQGAGGGPGCWASAHDQVWDHSVAAVCCGLDSRHFQASRPEWEWENPTILAQHSIDHQQLSDCKPHHMMLQGDAAASDLRHYSGNNMLSNRYNPHISHNAWGLLNGASIRNGGEGIETANCPLFPSSSSTFYGGLGNSALTEFYAGNGGYGEIRSPFEQHRHLLGLMNFDQRLMHNIPQRDVCTADFTARLGLNLGARTYFSAEDSGLMRFGKRLRPNSPGLQIPLCQAEGCKADLSIAKHYHRRHKVCEFHSKAATVIIGGQTQRFCQQCSRFHLLPEFDEGKRSCRKRLADHNRRRRKPQPNTSGSPTTEKPAQKSDEQERIEGDNSSNGSQIKTVSGSDNIQVSVSAISMAPSAPVPIKSEKRQLSATHSVNNEKETHQQFMQGQRTGPSLSLSTFGGGTTITSQRQSPGKKFGGADLPVAWLKPVESNSNLMESLSKSSISMQTLSDSSSPSRHFVEPVGSSSSMQGLPHSMQKSSSLTSLRDPVGNLDWIFKNMSDQGNEQLGEFGSANINLQVKSEAQEVLSLLERGPVRKLEAADNHIQQTVRAPLEFLQHNRPSTIKGNESDHAIADQNQTDMKFSGLQALMPFNRSIYNNTDNVL